MSGPRPTPMCVSDLTLDLLLDGGLDATAAAAARAHLTGCSTCGARERELDGQRAAWIAAPPPLRLPAARPVARRWVAATAALAAAAAVLVVTLRRDRGDDGGATRAKGGVDLVLHIARGEIVRQAGPRERVEPGDRLQLVYSSPRAGYLAILSRDGAGRASVYFPEDGEAAGPAAAGVDRPLPRSTILDDVLGLERVHVLFCRQPIALGPLRAALAVDGALVAPAGCEVASFELDKRLPG